MDQMMSFINTQLRFLVDDNRYQAVDARETAVNGSNSVAVFASENLQFRFSTDRDQLLLDLRPGFSKSAKDWYSIDLVRRMFLGEREPSGLRDASFAEFIRDRLTDMEYRFSASEWSKTRKELDALKRVRSKEMFG